jgi:hypothetical protein
MFVTCTRKAPLRISPSIIITIDAPHPCKNLYNFELPSNFSCILDFQFKLTRLYGLLELELDARTRELASASRQLGLVRMRRYVVRRLLLRCARLRFRCVSRMWGGG